MMRYATAALFLVLVGCTRETKTEFNNRTGVPIKIVIDVGRGLDEPSLIGPASGTGVVETVDQVIEVVYWYGSKRCALRSAELIRLARPATGGLFIGKDHKEVDLKGC